MQFSSDPVKANELIKTWKAEARALNQCEWLEGVVMTHEEEEDQCDQKKELSFKEEASSTPAADANPKAPHIPKTPGIEADRPDRKKRKAPTTPAQALRELVAQTPKAQLFGTKKDELSEKELSKFNTALSITQKTADIAAKESESRHKITLMMRNSVSSEVNDTIDMIAGTTEDDSTPGPVYYKLFKQKYAQMTESQIRQLKGELKNKYDGTTSLINFCRVLKKTWTKVDLYDPVYAATVPDKIRADGLYDSLCDYFIAAAGRDHEMMFRVWAVSARPTTTLTELVMCVDRGIEEKLLPDKAVRAHITSSVAFAITSTPARDESAAFILKCDKWCKKLEMCAADSQCQVPGHEETESHTWGQCRFKLRDISVRHKKKSDK